MKKSFISLSITFFAAFMAILVISTSAFAQLTFTEDFENETTPSATSPHTFSESGMSFLSQLIFANLPQNYGFGASPKYIYLANTTNGVGQSATISITAGKPAFRVNSFAAYVASDQFGGTTTNGSITFVGNLLGGGTATATINVPSTGTVTPPLTREANEVVNGLSFTGTPLDGKLITSLVVQSSATVQFVLLDHINFTVDNTPPTITCPANVAVCGAALVPAVNVGSVTVSDNFPGIVTVTHIGDITPPPAGFSYNILRTYRATDVSGNFAECTQTITVNPIPTATASSNSPVCTGATIQLTGTGVGTYLWTAPNGAVAMIQNPPVVNANASNAGTYTFRVTDANGCTATASVAVTVNANPTATATSNSPICVGTTLNLTGGGVGTYSWTGVNGFTSSIQNPIIPGVTSLATGTYKITVTNTSGCTSTATTSVTVNISPTKPTITDTGTAFCQGSSTTLTSSTDPSYTSYTWERSLTGIANPNSFTTFGGTAQTQVITTSGVYRVVVRNQFNCTASDTTAVSFGDFVFSGSLGSGDATQTGRMNRFAVASTCAAPKTYPGNFTTSGQRFYDSYTVTNPRNVSVCATIGIITGCGTNIFSAAYLGSYNPTSLGTNYLGDPGSSFPGTAFYEVNISANGTMVVVVHEVNPGVGCSNYTLRIDVPRVALTPLALNLLSPTDNYSTGNLVKLAGPVINASNSITGSAVVEYKSGNAINLLPGFQVQSSTGSNFKVNIGGCAN